MGIHTIKLDGWAYQSLSAIEFASNRPYCISTSRFLRSKALVPFEENEMESKNINHSLLVQQLKQDSDQAFTKLYDLYSKQLYRNILRLVKEEVIAQELLQDLFLKIWEYRKEVDQEKSFKSFLYKVGENLVYGHFRKAAKDSRLINNLAINYVYTEPDAEQTVIAKENHALLKLAIEKLSPQRKQIYKLCKLEGKTYEEVSLELGISTSTIRNQIVKANKAVRQYFFINQDITVMVIVSQLLMHL